jgi:hypothetical protein
MAPRFVRRWFRSGSNGPIARTKPPVPKREKRMLEVPKIDFTGYVMPSSFSF